ncbi:twin-arginine translocation signal domain-containing protein [Caballeronia choica]
MNVSKTTDCRRKFLKTAAAGGLASVGGLAFAPSN